MFRSERKVNSRTMARSQRKVNSSVMVRSQWKEDSSTMGLFIWKVNSSTMVCLNSSTVVRSLWKVSSSTMVRSQWRVNSSVVVRYREEQQHKGSLSVWWAEGFTPIIILSIVITFPSRPRRSQNFSIFQKNQLHTPASHNNLNCHASHVACSHASEALSWIKPPVQCTIPMEKKISL